MRLLSLAINRGGGDLAPTAPDYVDPGTSDPPDPTPTDDPTAPTGTDTTPPTDPDTGEPEPGIDPNWTEPTRIELSNGSQTAVRTSTDPGTWGNAYVAAPLTGYDYWEMHIASSTPKNATLAVGVTNTELSLNDVPGVDAGTVAYWSNGEIWNDDTAPSTYATYGRGDKIMIARDNDTGNIWFGKNGIWLGSTPSVGGSGHQGNLTGSGPYYPFLALYSEDSTVTIKVATSKFSYSVPSGFYPIGQTPVQNTHAMAILGSSVTGQDPSGGQAVPFDSTLYEDGSWWSAGSPTRITIPSGVSYAAFSAHLSVANEGSSSVASQITIRKNGSSIVAATTSHHFLGSGYNVSTGAVAVEEGDYFEVIFYSFDTSVDYTAGGCYFSAEAVT